MFLSHPRFLCLALGVAALVCTLSAPSPVRAQIIVGNGTTGANTFPFGGTYQGEYQQVYSSSAFGSSPITITQIAFASAPGQGNATSYSFTGSLGLGTTSATPANPGTTFAGNKRADFTSVFTGTQNATLQNNGTFDLVFNVNPFVYNPSSGNLLLDVVNTSASPSLVFFVAGTTNGNDEPLMGRLYNTGGSGGATPDDFNGLRTRFTVGNNAALTPEAPALVNMAGALLAPGLGGLLTLRKRRKNAKQA